ncbi:kinase-like domain-containing protein [Lactifluus subvellereus]|nr:kinase-like domain-containing protein [Lactifluus subvellereus]
MATPQTIRIFVLSVDSNLNPHGEPFELPMPSESSVSILIQEARSLTPSLLGHLGLSSLKVWKLKQPVNFNPTYLTEVDRILRDFPPVDTFEGNDHVQQLAVYENIAQHFAGGSNTLQALIQFPAPHGDGEAGGISVKVGEDPWSFQIIVQDNVKHYRSYRLKNDFTALGSSLPRLLIEVNSMPLDEPPQDHYRMLLEAASVILFANQFLEAYKRNKSYILIAAYVGWNGDTERYILFQDEKINPRMVYYKTKTFKFDERVDRILFALELYNFFSALGKEGRNEDAINKIQAFQRSIKDHRDAYGLKSLTSGQNKRRRTSERENRDSDDYGNGGGGGAAEEQLETHGYVVIPDFFEDKGGRMEPLIKLPPHIRIVYRSTDTTKTELVAKHVDEESIELEVLEYLRTIQPQSLRIISLTDTVPTNTGKWTILPKMCTVRGDLSMFSGALRCGKFIQLGWDLIEGLVYLHEHGVAHLDIKPGNMVYTDDFRLQIIDFNSAVRVGCEDDMVEDVYGTRGWMAPEIREGSAYSPMRADRWSCGKVPLCFVETSGTKDGGDLGSFAEQLMDDNPLHRPSLADWSGRVDVMLCDGDDTDEVGEGGKKESKAQVKYDARADGGLGNRTKRRRVDGGYHELPANH